MVWAEALPNLLIGLREGLEAGLIVSILLAAVHRGSGAGSRAAAVPVWLGVAAAVVLALSFGAVLTFYRSVLSTNLQEALGGSLSVVAVMLVTGMVFWMRRTARTLSVELSTRVAEAMRVSAAALAGTAFMAVGREGVETALFLWTTAQASGQTLAPLVGAALGIAAAVVLCVLLYRSAVRLNLGVFFSRTAALLIVIAAGVLAYGLGDLQDAGWLPGHTWVAFDLSEQVDPGSWRITLITGVTELSPTMTWLQVGAYLAYLVSVLTVFVRAGRSRGAAARPVTDSAAEARRVGGDSGSGTLPGSGRQVAAASSASLSARAGPAPSHRRAAALACAALVMPPAAAALLIVFAPGADRQGAQQLQVTDKACAPGWSSAAAGADTFSVVNKSGHTVEVNLVQASSQGIVAEIETLGPATQENLSATLTPGSYFFRCLADGQPTTTSTTVQAIGNSTGQAAVGGSAVPVAQAVKPVTVADLQPAANAYHARCPRRGETG